MGLALQQDTADFGQIPPSPAVRLIGYLDTSLGSRQKSARLWSGLKELSVHPLLKHVASSTAFREIAASKRDFATFADLEKAVSARQHDFNLGFFQKIRLGALLMPWHSSIPLMQGLAAEYARTAGFPEGMSALEIGLYLALSPQAEPMTRAVFDEVDRHLGV